MATHKSLGAALRDKVERSIGLVDRPCGSAGFKNDFVVSNRQAVSRRDIRAFEEKLAENEVELDSDSDSDEDAANLDWSSEAADIEQLAKSKRTRQFGHLEIITPFLKTLRLKDCRIKEIDHDTVQSLSNLQELNVSGNSIEHVFELPQQLVSLQAYDNRIERVELSQAPCAQKLVHLGLGYNQIRWVNFLEDLPNLKSLDLSFNALTDLDDTLRYLAMAQDLKVLHLSRNPIALLPKYRAKVIAALPDLEVLDGIPISLEDRREVQMDEQLENAAKMTALRLDIHSFTLSHKVPRAQESDPSAAAVKDPAELPETMLKKFGVVVQALLPSGEIIRTPFKETPTLDAASLEDSEEQEQKEDDEAKSDFSQLPYRLIEKTYEVDFSSKQDADASVDFRDAIDLDGIHLKIFLVEQLLLEDQIETGTDSDNAGEDESTEEQVKSFSIVSQEEHILSEGVIQAGSILAPECNGTLTITDSSIRLENPLATILALHQMRQEASKELAAQDETEFPFSRCDTSIKFSLWVNSLPAEQVQVENEEQDV